MSAHGPMPRSAWIFPALSVVLFAGATALGYTFAPSVVGLAFAVALLVILFGTVFAAVHHAEVIAERIGEPYGTLLLTLAVTIIEVALIATIMLGETAVPTLARDTVFAVVMIVCNGLVGVCILTGGLRYREQDVRIARQVRCDQGQCIWVHANIRVDKNQDVATRRSCYNISCPRRPLSPR